MATQVITPEQLRSIEGTRLNLTLVEDFYSGYVTEVWFDPAKVIEIDPDTGEAWSRSWGVVLDNDHLWWLPTTIVFDEPDEFCIPAVIPETEEKCWVVACHGVVERGLTFGDVFASDRAVWVKVDPTTHYRSAGLVSDEDEEKVELELL